MKTEVHKINLDGNKMELKVAIFDGKDGKEFKKLFDLWKKLNFLPRNMKKSKKYFGV